MTNKILRLHPYKNLLSWSVSNLLTHTISSVFPLEQAGKFLTPVKEKITINDSTFYKQITVKINGNGVVKRGEKLGKDIGTKKQYIARKNQLIISKIDARNGAFGIVPEELDGAVVTADFMLFKVDNINTEFLMLVLSSSKFRDQWQSRSSGTTNRQRVNQATVLSAMIPVPSEKKQEELLAIYLSALQKCSDKLMKIDKIEKELDDFIISSLGIKIHEKDFSKNSNILQEVSFKTLKRWDVWSNKGFISSSKYKIKKLKDLVTEKPFYGAAEKAIPKKGDVRYIRITDINDDGTLNEKFVSAQKVNAKYLLKTDDFLIARTGSVGRTFLYNESYGKAMFAGYLIKFILDKSQINPRYLLNYTKSSAYKKWIESNQRISSRPNINAQEFLESDIVLPPMYVQEKITVLSDEKRKRIRELKLEAEKIKSQALLDFECALFL